MAIVPLANGFEEIEAITIIDVLRRANIPVVTAAVGENPVKGAHGITVTADVQLTDVNIAAENCVVLPGGMPGAENLKNDSRVIELIKNVYNSKGIVAAICAAPIVLAAAGVLTGKKVTCYPGFEGQLTNGVYTGKPVEATDDGRIITGEAPGAAMEFALKVVEVYLSKQSKETTANELRFHS